MLIGGGSMNSNKIVVVQTPHPPPRMPGLCVLLSSRLWSLFLPTIAFILQHAWPNIKFRTFLEILFSFVSLYKRYANVLVCVLSSG